MEVKKLLLISQIKYCLRSFIQCGMRMKRTWNYFWDIKYIKNNFGYMDIIIIVFRYRDTIITLASINVTKTYTH